MASVKASPEVVRQMKSDLNKTARELNQAGAKVKAALQSSSDWNDAQGEKYRQLMQRIGRLIVSPIGTLDAAQPKLEKLAQSLDEYNRIKF